MSLSRRNRIVDGGTGLHPRPGPDYRRNLEMHMRSLENPRRATDRSGRLILCGNFERIDFDPVAPQMLGAIKRGIGAADEFAEGGRGLAAESCRAETGREESRRAIEEEFLRLELLSDALDHDLHGTFVHMSQDLKKFLAAHAPGDVGEPRI